MRLGCLFPSWNTLFAQESCTSQVNARTRIHHQRGNRDTDSRCPLPLAPWLACKFGRWELGKAAGSDLGNGRGAGGGLGGNALPAGGRSYVVRNGLPGFLERGGRTSTARLLAGWVKGVYRIVRLLWESERTVRSYMPPTGKAVRAVSPRGEDRFVRCPDR